MHPPTPSPDSPDPSGTPQTPSGPAKTCTPCTATTSAGLPCRAWAVRGSDPPRCAPHRGGRRPVGAPAANDNALKHGVYASPHRSKTPFSAWDLEGGRPRPLPPVGQRCPSGQGDWRGGRLAARIAHIDRRVDRLAAYLDQLTVGRRSPNGGDGTAGTITIQDYAGLVALEGQLCSRIARLLREQQQLQQAWQQDRLQQAVNDALDALSEMWGVEL